MKIESLRFDEVMTRFHLEHDADRAHESNTNQATEGLLGLADAQLGGWSRVLLGRRHLRSVILPWHESEGGDIKLVPKTGLRVVEAARKIAAMRELYAQQSQVCWRKIERAARVPRAAVFLSTRAIDSEHYAELETKDGLVHLDGLHRMIAWELDGLLAEDELLEAFVAGPRSVLAEIASNAPED